MILLDYYPTIICFGSFANCKVACMEDTNTQETNETVQLLHRQEHIPACCLYYGLNAM